MDNNDVNLSGIDIFGESIKGQKGEKKKVLVTETVLRDAHQSLMATRMRTEDMLSVAAKMDEIGYYSFEM
ncbi:MAG: oxaloacetate decarboxylase subunit alpha, partial [Acetomicrobium sp.]|nr:oxaloacetate decarboxylase subunit alpha [Acetomicrobium sp.]